jgi:CheY-like chemotaxis protein
MSFSLTMHVEVDSALKKDTTLRALRYLLVDDSAPSRKMMVRLVAKQSGGITEARNGAEAVECMKLALKGGDPFDVVLMDAFMPVLDGFQAAFMMREMGFKGIIVGITGSSLSEDINAFKSYGADEVHNRA